MHNERNQERHVNYMNGFSERYHFQSNVVILEQKWDGVLLTLNLLSGFFISFTQWKGPRVTWKVVFRGILFFGKKSDLWQFDLFRSGLFRFDWVWSKLSQTTVTIEPDHCLYLVRTWLRSLNSQDMISQANNYVADTALRYYMMYGGQYST